MSLKVESYSNIHECFNFSKECFQLAIVWEVGCPSQCASGERHYGEGFGKKPED